MGRACGPKTPREDAAMKDKRRRPEIDSLEGRIAPSAIGPIVGAGPHQAAIIHPHGTQHHVSSGQQGSAAWASWDLKVYKQV